MLQISEKAATAFRHCLRFEDSEMILKELPTWVHHEYISWDAYANDPTGLLLAGEELLNKAIHFNTKIFILPSDGNGSFIFFAESEDILVGELLRIGMILEERSDYKLQTRHAEENI